MGTISSRLGLNSEHKTFIKDLTSVVISYTPFSGIVDTIKFSHKWFGKKRSIRRTIKYMKIQSRKSHIKSRNRKIKDTYLKLIRKYKLDANTPTWVIAKMKE